MKLSVADTRCDSSPAKTRIHAHGYSLASGRAYLIKGPWHTDDKGCHGGLQAWNSLSYTDNNGIIDIVIEICNDGVECRASPYMADPNH